MIIDELREQLREKLCFQDCDNLTYAAHSSNKEKEKRKRKRIKRKTENQPEIRKRVTKQ